MGLSKKEKETFLLAAKLVEAKPLAQVMSCLALCLAEDHYGTNAYPLYEEYLDGDVDYMVKASESGVNNFVWPYDPFCDLTLEQRQLARSLMLLLVMEAES